jgi:hypothetical protein
MTDAEALLAIEAVKKVKGQYFYFLDTKRWSELRALFTDDADFDSAHRGAYQFDGPDHFIEYASAGLAQAVSVHHGHTPIVDLVSDTEATAVWAMSDYVENPDPERPVKFIGYGHYHERYRCEGGTWKISAWALTRLRVDQL